MEERPPAAPLPIRLVTTGHFEAMAAERGAPFQRLAKMAGFSAGAGQILFTPAGAHWPDEILLGAGQTEASDPGVLRSAAGRLPAGDYVLASGAERIDPFLALLAWRQGAYRFERYRKAPPRPEPRLAPPAGCDLAFAEEAAAAFAAARDMINTGANDMGPAAVEIAARDLAVRFGATIEVTMADALLAGYPAVHAVGAAASPERAPRMIELTWGAPDLPLVCLVGKGVVFDSGGLDLKPAAGMRNMKKDMGGAAHVLALARLVMAARLKVRLAVLLPVVENAVASEAMRPGDILASRSGLSIEVGNTDAEGRLILADALARATELAPTLTLDMATLTGAARVALGPEVIPFFTPSDDLARDLLTGSATAHDPLWRLPLWTPYASALDSDVADIKNDPDPWAQAGSVTAALFLQRFAPKTEWAHFDIFAWNPRSTPGRPAGAEVQAISAIFAALEARWGV